MLNGLLDWLLLPLWILAVILVILLVSLVLWIWAIIDCLASRLKPIEKIIWLIVIIFLSIIGVIIYYVFTKLKGEHIMVAKDFKGKRLLRAKDEKVVAGVCGGIAKYLEIDPTVVRLLWVVLTVFSMGAGIIAYIVAWIIVPEENSKGKK